MFCFDGDNVILVDFSSIIHRMVFSASKEVQPKEVDGEYITSEFSDLMLYYIMNELINVQLRYKPDYGEMILLFDDWKKDYWRKDVYAAYKAGRSSAKAKTKINYTEVYEYVNELVQELITNTPWRCVTVDRAEADDTILVLAKEFHPHEKVLIYSPDKDMIQAQRDNENVVQYSALTKKWLVPEGKHDSMEHWTLEHVMLGDASDGVPKIVAHTEFSDSFKKHMKLHEIDECYHEVHTFKYGVFDSRGEVTDTLDARWKAFLLTTFKEHKTNRAGEKIGLDLYKDIRFGASGLKKALDKCGGVEEFLDSHPLYREHYERNFTLVMEEGIPDDIRNETIRLYNEADLTYNRDAFVDYLLEHNLGDIEQALIKVFECQETLSIDNCGW